MDDVLLVLFAITAGLVGGYARHGLVANIAKVHLLFPVVTGVASVSYLFVRLFQPGGDSLRLPLAVTATFVLIATLAANYRIPGSGIIAFGLAANLLVLVANGHIPVDTSILTNLNPLQEPMLPGPTKFAFLGNQIPIPIFGVLVSYGDLIILAGIIVLVANSTLRQNSSAASSTNVLNLDLEGAPQTSVKETLPVPVQQPPDAPNSVHQAPNAAEPSQSGPVSNDPPTSRPPLARNQSDNELAWSDSGRSDGMFRRIDLTASEPDTVLGITYPEPPSQIQDKPASTGYNAQHDDGGLSVEELFGDFDRTIADIGGVIDLRTTSDAPKALGPKRIESS